MLIVGGGSTELGLTSKLSDVSFGSIPDVKPRRLQRPLCRGNQTSDVEIPNSLA